MFIFFIHTVLVSWAYSKKTWSGLNVYKLYIVCNLEWLCLETNYDGSFSWAKSFTREPKAQQIEFHAKDL